MIDEEEFDGLEFSAMGISFFIKRLM